VRTTALAIHSTTHSLSPRSTPGVAGLRTSRRGQPLSFRGPLPGIESAEGPTGWVRVMRAFRYLDIQAYSSNKPNVISMLARHHKHKLSPYVSCELSSQCSGQVLRCPLRGRAFGRLRINR
jgi:hypothetical protein